MQPSVVEDPRGYATSHQEGEHNHPTPTHPVHSGQADRCDEIPWGPRRCAMKVGDSFFTWVQGARNAPPRPEQTRSLTLCLVCRQPAEGYSHSVSPQRRAWFLLAAGSVLFLVCVAVLVLVRRPAAGFGWYAYAPLSDTAFPSGFLFLDPTHWWAVAVGIVGLVAAGWAAGYLAGRRAK